MPRLARAKAEAYFSATKKKKDRVTEEKERHKQDQAEQLARLRALRLSKQADEA